MTDLSPKDTVAWLRQLDHLLARGSTAKDLQALRNLLSGGPSNWHTLPARPRGWRRLPCWARVFANPYAEPDWVAQVVALCTQAGAVHEAPLVGDKPLPGPVFMGLTDRLGDVGARAYVDYALGQMPKPGAREGFPACQVAWLARVFSQAHQWKGDAVSPRVVSWEFLDTFPAFRTHPLAKKVWALGLGLVRNDTFAPRMLEFAAMHGLDGNVVIERADLPPASLQQWSTQDLGPWRPAPAWGWALLCGVLHGSRMLVREVQKKQPSPWDPNASLSGQDIRVGDWLLQTSLLPSRPTSSPGSMIVELDELGFDWGKGVPGERAIDILQAQGLGPGILGLQRWGQITAQAEHALMDASLPQAPDSAPASSPPAKGRL